MKYLACEVYREAEGIVELESVLAAEGADLSLLDDRLEHIETRVDSLGEILFFYSDELGYVITLLNKLGISRGVLFDNSIADLISSCRATVPSS